MGVKLDWDIEAEKGKKKEHREDSEQRSRRYRSVFQLFLTVAVFAIIMGGVAYLVLRRWEQVNQYTEQLLVDTVQAEIASLRVGDEEAFTTLQRSATTDWATIQNAVYQDYQQLKVSSDVILSGEVLSIEVEGQRGRVQVQEIIDSVPYVQTWFYWRYDDGWYHVPPDYTFWGQQDSIETDQFLIRYRNIDAEVAAELEQDLVRWWADTCSIVNCEAFPLMTVDILPAPNSPVRWADNEQNAWQMVVPSPYTDRARSDRALNTDLQTDIARLFAARVVSALSNGNEGAPVADATFLQDSITAWLVGRYIQINPETYFIQSLTETYGVGTVPRILQNIQPNSTISLAATVAGVPSVSELTVDWRDFVLWRLNLEDDLIARSDEAQWATLYDFTNQGVRDAAYQRFTNNFTASNRSVTSATVTPSDSGNMQLIARVNVTRGFESGEEIIVFNLINGNWLRAN